MSASSEQILYDNRYSSFMSDGTETSCICSFCSNDKSQYLCNRCRSYPYCSIECASKHKSKHQNNCDIMKSNRTWHSLKRSNVYATWFNPNYPYTLWSPSKSNWNQIIYPTSDDIKTYMHKITHSTRNIAILSTYNATKLPHAILEIIIHYLPLFGHDETIQFLDEYPDSKYNLSLDQYHTGFIHGGGDTDTPIRKRLDWGTGFMNRFLLSVNLITKEVAMKTDMNIGLRDRLSKWIDIVYWYRMGPKVKFVKSDVHKPADILGVLNNGLYFYYKDGHPGDFAQYGLTHDKYFYLVADNIENLFEQMDKRDIELFLKHKKKWKDLKKSRSTCVFGLHVSKFK